MTDQHDARWSKMRLVAAIALAIIACMRCLISFVPHVYFDSDPAMYVGLGGGLGPAGSLWLDIIALLCAAALLLSDVLKRKGIAAHVVVCALVPIPIVLYHGLSDAGDLWRGVSWATALISMIALAHAAREPMVRRIVLCVLAAVLVPVLCRAVADVTWEYDATVRDYQANRDAFLAEKGWDENSASAKIFERRLMQRQPDAWFVSPNIFGSLAAVGCVLALVIGLRMRPLRERGPGAMVAAFFGLLCLVLVLMTGSKGALGVVAIGAAIILWTSVARKQARLAPATVLVCALLALIAIATRGVILPEGFVNEKSLLFRWHYMTSATESMSTHMLGVGADGFQEVATQHRHPRNPEETASAHNVLVDWGVAVGALGGLFWCAVLVMLFGTRKPDVLEEESSRSDQTQDDSDVITARGIRLVALVAAVVVVGVPLRLEVGTLSSMDLMVRIVGMIGFGLMIPALWHATRLLNARMLSNMLLACAAVLAVHGMIEMTLTDPSSALWAWACIGLAAGRTTLPVTRGRWAVGVAGLPIVLSIVILAVGAWPMQQQEWRIKDAASQLWVIASTRNSASPPTPKVFRDARVAAAEQLVDAFDVHVTNEWPLLDAAREFERAALMSPRAEAATLVARSLEIAQQSYDRFGSDASRVQIILAEQLVAQIEERAVADRALILARELAERDPLGVSSWKRLGDLHWNSSQLEPAREAYQRALENNANFVLDPLKQLDDQTRAMIEERLEQDDA